MMGQVAIEEEENTAMPTTPSSALLSNSLSSAFKSAFNRLTRVIELIQSQLDQLRKELAEMKAKDIQLDIQLDELRKELAQSQKRQLDALRKELRQPR
tara:strand:+ start:821 stop:1114 length:294 start_codon:yes stop_codon:yes gene_type:complete